MSTPTKSDILHNVFQKDMETVINHLHVSFAKELHQTPGNSLDKYFHFKWNDKASIEWNLYEFHDMLNHYGRVCEQWESHHNGISSVVERVRDKYLMPKIKAFVAKMHSVSK